MRRFQANPAEMGLCPSRVTLRRVKHRRRANRLRRPSPRSHNAGRDPPVAALSMRFTSDAGLSAQAVGIRRVHDLLDWALPQWEREAPGMGRGDGRPGVDRRDSLPHRLRASRHIGRGAAVRPRLGARIRLGRHAGRRARVRDHPTPRAPAELCPGYRYLRYN